MVTKSRSLDLHKISSLLIKLIGLTLSGLMLYILFRRNALVKSVPSKPKQTKQTNPQTVATNTSSPKTEQIDLSSWQYILVNYDHPVTQEFIDNLKLVNTPEGYGPQLKVDERIYSQLEQMLSAAKADGVELYICSAFRSVECQTKLFNAQVDEQLNLGLSKEQAIEEAASWVAKPGCSEHHTGLALDIVAPSYQTLDDDFETTDAFAWLYKNLPKYGFILRYPKNKKDITHVNYEPWHFRFVGDKAQEITDSGLCLEEYFSKIKQI